MEESELSVFYVFFAQKSHILAHTHHIVVILHKEHGDSNDEARRTAHLTHAIVDTHLSRCALFNDISSVCLDGMNGRRLVNGNDLITLKSIHSSHAHTLFEVIFHKQCKLS
uniref:FHA domain-containing protein n=1 Tax=Parascaris univalens TaxID=6257 RepID=A0A915BL26_PARUN